MQMIEPSIALAVIGRIAPGSIEEPAVDYPTETYAATARVLDYTGLALTTPIPVPESVTRAEWAEVLIDGFNGLDLAGRPANRSSELLRQWRLVRAGRTSASARAGADLGVALGQLGMSVGTSVAMGSIIGALATRVMGQYDNGLFAPGYAPRLLLLTQNINAGARRLGVPVEDFTRWVVTHETTHAVQFSAAPHLAERLRAHVDALRASTVDAQRDGMSRSLLGPQMRERLSEVQGIMSLIEGHAEHVMDAAIGDDRHLPALRAALDEQRRNQPPWLVLLGRLLQLQQKTDQYVQGKVFCDALAAHGGPELLALPFREPRMIPTLAQINDPSAWIREHA